jgi:hypothetical protein
MNKEQIDEFIKKFEEKKISEEEMKKILDEVERLLKDVEEVAK